MKKSNKFSPEVRERAVRMVQEHRVDYPSLWAAIESIAPEIGCVPQTLNEWVKGVEVDTGVRGGVTTAEAQRVKELEREVKEQHKIRLAGIDAPEKKQPFGNRSKESLSELAYDKILTVETDKRDKYGRQVGKVPVNGQDVNLVQVERGMAWFYRQYQREQSPNDRRLYEAAEDAAKADRRGLWHDAGPVPPWEFRHSKNAVDPQKQGEQ
jgi:endonuclease YncB( thermonuclease family)